jgi:hypothetical protein
MTNFVRENYLAITEPVCSTKLVAFLINSDEVSINFFFYNPAAHELIKRECGPCFRLK